MSRHKKSETEGLKEGAQKYATFAGHEIDKPVSVAQWIPKEGDSRAFELKGFEKHEGENGDYNIYHGVDLDTGELFSFIGGGLFGYFMRENTIANGDKLGVVYKGMVELKAKADRPAGRAKQWEIYKLK